MSRGWMGLVLVCALIFGRRAEANDGVGQFGEGGIVLLGKDPRVVMATERLTVSLRQIRVEYTFVNESPEDVVAEVAFPIPPFDIDTATRWSDSKPEGETFDVGFVGTADGQPIRVARQVRALVGDRDVTDLLQGMGLDWERFAHHDNHDGDDDQVRRLAPAAREKLRLAGAVEARGEYGALPRWKVAITYHWTQRFPAGKPVRVTHSYAPITGNSNTVGALDAFAKEFPSACLDTATTARLRRVGANRGWEAVDYILTTANTWKTPIREFELVVERDPNQVVTFCWDGKVEREGRTRLVARKKRFVPERELTVYFIPTGQ
jgi:hypothetical protein